LIWIMGAYMVLVDNRDWLFVVISLLFVAGLILPHIFKVPRKLVLLCIFIFILSVGYNMWFDSRNVSSLTTNYDYALPDKEITLKGTITTPVDVDGNRVSFVMKETYHEKLQVFIRLTTEKEQLEAEQWQRGDFIQLTGTLQKPEDARNYEMFEYPAYLQLQQIHWIVNAKGLQLVVVHPPDSWSFDFIYRWTDATRQALGDKVERIFSETYSGYMKSLLIGLRDDLQPEQFQQFSTIGLTHIMAISGLHVAVFIAGCMGLMKYAGLTREKNILITLMLIPLYILLTGAAPSVKRAGSMAMIALYTLRIKRLKDGLNIIFIVGAAMLMYNPYYLFQISFQLSFIVTLGLMISVPILMRVLPIRSQVIRSSLSVTVAAQLFSFPLSIYYFNQFSLLSWLANLLLVPLISLIVIPLGMIALLLSFLSESIGTWIAFFINIINSGIFLSIEWLNEFNVFLLIWPSPSHMWILLYFFLLGVILWCLVRGIPNKLNRVRLLPLYLSLGGLCILLTFGYNQDDLNRSGLVQFIDVGQGDAILIRTPERKIILIDGGGTLSFGKQENDWTNRKDPYEVGKDLLVPLLKKRGVHHIDYLIMTHGHMDHYGGLQAVLEQIPVRRFIFNGATSDAESLTKLFDTALAEEIPIYIANEGDKVRVDAHTNLSFLFPLNAQNIMDSSDQNRLSVVSLLEMYDAAFLFTGDMEQIAEYEIMERLRGKEEEIFAIDVMKVAHHGSRTSTTDEWLAYWRPKISVIQVGRYNSYGHPHPTVLDKLRDYSEIYRNDYHGEVQIEVLPESLRIRTKLTP
jgi:competence protein ComEC